MREPLLLQEWFVPLPIFSCWDTIELLAPFLNDLGSIGGALRRAILRRWQIPIDRSSYWRGQMRRVSRPQQRGRARIPARRVVLQGVALVRCVPLWRPRMVALPKCRPRPGRDR